MTSLRDPLFPVEGGSGVFLWMTSTSVLSCDVLGEVLVD